MMARETWDEMIARHDREMAFIRLRFYIAMALIAHFVICFWFVALAYGAVVQASWCVGLVAAIVAIDSILACAIA